MTWAVVKVAANGTLPRVVFRGSELAARNEFNTIFLRMKRGRLQLRDSSGQVIMDTATLGRGVRLDA